HGQPPSRLCNERRAGIADTASFAPILRLPAAPANRLAAPLTTVLLSLPYDDRATVTRPGAMVSGSLFRGIKDEAYSSCLAVDDFAAHSCVRTKRRRFAECGEHAG